MKKGQINEMTKTYSYSAENNEFLEMAQNNYFFVSMQDLSSPTRGLVIRHTTECV